MTEFKINNTQFIDQDLEAKKEKSFLKEMVFIDFWDIS